MSPGSTGNLTCYRPDYSATTKSCKHQATLFRMKIPQFFVFFRNFAHLFNRKPYRHTIA